MMNKKATNRLPDLDELNRPSYRKVLRTMRRLLDRCPGFYLHPSKQWEYSWALEQAALFPGCWVLDAGCEASIFPVYLAEQGCRVTALDVPLPARPDAFHIKYVAGGLTTLPFAADSFDRVFCISVIEHLERNQALTALDDMHRVLQPGGKLLLTSDYYENAREPLQYEGPGGTFPVDWHVFDQPGLQICFPAHTALNCRATWI
jgi:2-polyprenyl-3-methyl-5-hydroxy-6-metoxy-1,4-benzoquinol methylase